MIKVKSVYSKALAEDGRRYLVELFWPEGIHTRDAGVNEWFASLGPSYDLQRFEFKKTNWQHYKSKYEAELMSAVEKKDILQRIARQAHGEAVTLLYGSRDPKFNHAVVIKELIEQNFL